MPGIEPTPTAHIRNVVLLGHGGTGKTELAESLLRLGGAGDGRGGNFDFEPEEQERHHSLSLAIGSMQWRECRINIVDAPGTPDAIGDAYSALRAADVAVLVVDAAVGVQAQHDQLWAACEEMGLSRVVFLNKLDKAQASFQPNVDALRERYGKPLAAVEMPIGVGEEFSGVIDLLHFTAVELIDGERVEEEVPASRREQAQRNRDFLVEAIVENDDALLERYLEGDVPSAKELVEVFAHGIAQGGFFPVLCGSARSDMGTQMVADFLVEECPPPRIDATTPTVVFKTLSDPFVGRINLLRVGADGISADDHLTVARTGGDVRLHNVFTLVGKEQTPLRAAAAGDLCAVAKLDDVGTGDVLVRNGQSADLEPPAWPPGYHRVAIEAESMADDDKLSPALTRLTDEDPSLRVVREPETRQVVLHAYGPGHVDVTRARMKRKFGVSVRTVPLRLSYRETIRGTAEGFGRHVKQSGGHGQYAVCTIEVSPLPRGEGFAFTDEIVGGAIPHNFIPSVEKGIRQTMESGVLAGYPVVDVAVRLFDGKFHSVDSSQMAFEVAGSLAFRAAAAEAGLCLLEPWVDVEVTVPDPLTGDIMGDLSARRGHIAGMDQAATPGYSVVRAQVPEAEMLTYMADLRSLSSGAGTVQMTYSHHDEAPEPVRKALVAAAAETASA